MPQDQAVAHPTAQQLICTAWNVLFALILVVLVFGWTGGKELVGSLLRAGEGQGFPEMKSDRKRKKVGRRRRPAKRAAKHHGQTG